MDILAYNDTNFNSCVSLFMKVFNSPPWNDHWIYEKASQRITDFINHPNFKGFVVFEDDVLIAASFGYKKTWWNNEEFYIEEMLVDIERQKRNYGTRLIKHIKMELKKENINAITLLTRRNVPAKDFYLKNGFYISGNMIFMKAKF